MPHVTIDRQNVKRKLRLTIRRNQTCPIVLSPEYYYSVVSIALQIPLIQTVNFTLKPPKVIESTTYGKKPN